MLLGRCRQVVVLVEQVVLQRQQPCARTGQYGNRGSAADAMVASRLPYSTAMLETCVTTTRRVLPSSRAARPASGEAAVAGSGRHQRRAQPLRRARRTHGPSTDSTIVCPGCSTSAKADARLKTSCEATKNTTEPMPALRGGGPCAASPRRARWGWRPRDGANCLPGV
ncbi:hypothetical protein TSOC_006536 [Tetrabaena socialis]|uniref:Uncharacterized protein n=1 Tax=Tetrabaena socialis TaxID=47790 RepID=A0A2J8A3E5_9CHLO|nr:hypothetical protein TSOC_006536 [Tetrabaena socialis]|eukprot:PNH07034.1 hypothetical protein TSOC_006536 [Tetrabaena socialis]